jgi:hypothetical protein
MVATYAWLAGGEIPSQRLRSYTFGIAAAVGFAGAWLATFTAPYFINPSALNWGPEYGMLPYLFPLPSLLQLFLPPFPLNINSANTSLNRLDMGSLMLANCSLDLHLPARDQEPHTRGD